MVSIILALYNGEKYITDQLRTIIFQTYRNIQLIIIDDCSTDNGLKTAIKFLNEANFNNYVLIKNTDNLGPTKTFEKGVAFADGDYIMFSDQDDVWVQSKVSVLLSSLKVKNKKVAVNPSYVIKKNELIDKLYIKIDREKALEGLFQNKFRGASMLIEKKYLLKILPFSKYDLYDKWIYFHSVIRGQLTINTTPLDYYRIHDNNVVGVKPKFSNKARIKERFQRKIFFYLDLKKSIIHSGNQEVINRIDQIIRFYECFNDLYEKKFRIKNIYYIIRFILKSQMTFKEKIILLSYIVR